MDSFARLCAKFPKMKIDRDFAFSRHTTIGCGGGARLCLYPEDLPQAVELLRTLEREKIPYCLLGAGANVLPSDEMYEGVVVRLTKMNRIEREGEEIFLFAGATGGSLCRFARENSLGGMEPFTGIPMTVGGGIVMNAGVSEAHFSDSVKEVTAYTEGKIYNFSLGECNFSEKYSLFQEGFVVLKAILSAKRAPSDQIRKRTEFFRQKRKCLPKGRSMGCVFVNPKGDSAGRLIEECGLKGARCGKAAVSEIHANFILNEGGTCRDVETLVRTVKECVLSKTGILLREEIRPIGRNHT